MAMDKINREINRKLDLILDKLGIKDEANQFDDGLIVTTFRKREVTPQEQDAIDNAPKAEASVPPAERGPRVTQQNAPDTSSSVPRDAVGSVTVETKQPSGKTSVETKPASAVKGKDS